MFESRRPEYPAWTEWEQDSAETAAVVDRVGTVTLRLRVTTIDLPLVSFQQISTFPDGMRIASDSTLRFHEINRWLVGWLLAPLVETFTK